MYDYQQKGALGIPELSLLFKDLAHYGHYQAAPQSLAQDLLVGQGTTLNFSELLQLVAGGTIHGTEDLFRCDQPRSAHRSLTI